MPRGSFVELHLSSMDQGVLGILERLGYTAAAVTMNNDYVDSSILILNKLVITEGSVWKLRMHSRFDIVSVVPWSRFVLNKLIRDERIHVITISDADPRIVPSKAQARVMADEGKALEVVVNPILGRGEQGLAFLKGLLNSMSRIEGLTIVVSQGIRNRRDVRNPRDVISLLNLLAPAREWASALSRDALTLISDAIYMRGLCE